jgi:hypothetical protein
MVRYRMIGPAMSCGKSSRYSAACTGLFCAVASPRYTSTTYEMAWNVKNEIPIGSRTIGKGIGGLWNALSTAFTLSPKKLAYLKIPRTRRLTVTASARNAFDRRSDVALKRCTRIAAQ